MSNTKQLSARERIEVLLDDASFVEIGSFVTSRSTDFNLQQKQNPADGVITGQGLINGKSVYVYSQDAKVLGGSIGEMHAKKIVKIYDLAIKTGSPVIGIVDCAGLRLQEATDALNAFGEIFLKQTVASGVIPQITAIFGTCGGGTALIPTLTDFTFMTKENSKLFVNSPNALDGNNESKLNTASATYHSEVTGLADDIFETEEELLEAVRNLATILPSNNEDNDVFDDCEDDLNRIVPEVVGMAYDARTILQSISDDGKFIEIKKAYSKDMITAFICLDGTTIGAVANQLSDGEIELDASISTKGALKVSDFVKFCDAFGIPVLTLTNVKGFKATVDEEKTLSEAVAKLTASFATASVPKVNLITGDAFGTAYIAMNSKALGADITFAWPDASIGMMDSKLAVGIMYQNEINNAVDKTAFLDEKTKEYQELQSSAMSAAKRGYIDDIIEPDATRKRLIVAFEMLFTKKEQITKKHTTI